MTTNITIPRATLEQLVVALKQIQSMTDGRDFYMGSPPKESKERKILNLTTEALTAGRAALEGAERDATQQQPIVTRKMIAAAHGVTLDGGHVVLSGELLERIFLAMKKAEK